MLEEITADLAEAGFRLCPIKGGCKIQDPAEATWERSGRLWSFAFAVRQLSMQRGRLLLDRLTVAGVQITLERGRLGLRGPWQPFSRLLRAGRQDLAAALEDDLGPTAASMWPRL